MEAEKVSSGHMGKAICAAFKTDIVRNTTNWLPQQMAKNCKGKGSLKDTLSTRGQKQELERLCKFLTVHTGIREAKGAAALPLAQCPAACASVHHRHG